MKNGIYEIDFGTEFNDLLNSEGGEAVLNEAFQSAWNAFTYDHIDVFYIDVEKLTLTTKTTSIGSFATHRVNLSSGAYNNYLKDDFGNIAKINEKLNLLDAIRKEMARQLEGYSNYEKIIEVHDWMVENIEYDTNLVAEEPYSISGALTPRRAVCEGYARAFKYLLDELDIPCVMVIGTATNSQGETENHAWNYVQLNGNWYAVDSTWDDPVVIGGGTASEESRYKYFLVGREVIDQDHSPSGQFTEGGKIFSYPNLNYESYSN